MYWPPYLDKKNLRGFVPEIPVMQIIQKYLEYKDGDLR